MSKKSIPINHIERQVCYQCHRPKSTCYCAYITPIETKTRFIILMHPKEFNRTKNGTGHFTNLSLTNCEIHMGIDFSKHKTINKTLNNPNNNCYVIYPSEQSINLNETNIKEKKQNTVLFLIDATWASSRTILAKSPNLDSLKKVSFTHTKSSAFQFKRQPKEYCLSTMESTLCILELLNEHGEEVLEAKALDDFLRPFEKMVEYQSQWLKSH